MKKTQPKGVWMEAAPMVFPVRYVSEGTAIQTTSRGLSSEGIAVRSLIPPRIGARVSLALYLPGNPKPEVAVGVVSAATRARPVPAGFWVRFTAIDTAARERITALVIDKAREMRDSRPDRGFQRFHTKFTVRFRTAREFVREHTENISRGGVFIQTQSPPQVDEVITVQLELPDGGPPATSSGIVMHRVSVDEAEQNGLIPGIGVQFLDADDQFRQRIDRYIEHLSAPSA
jgi:type IV pilus assembly protein PilZ